MQEGIEQAGQTGHELVQDLKNAHRENTAMKRTVEEERNQHNTPLSWSH